ncbi:MAG: hypothetical protein LQ338_004343 [Usnochroma carphineum]|nr:MAG: hypothetical protein LQ338_004343 [Usnochroma carphineum]
MATHRSSRFGHGAKSVTSDMVKLEITDDSNHVQNTPIRQSVARGPGPHTNVQYPGLKSASKRKRLASTDRKADEQPAVRSKVSKSRARPYAPRSWFRTKRNSTINKAVVNTRSTQHEARWYTEVDTHKQWKRSDLQTLTYTIKLIKNCIEAVETGSDEVVQFSILRRRLHQVEFYDFITDVLVVRSKLLEDQGFPAVFDNESFPFDLRADALMLFKKWSTRRWDPDLLRGIVTRKGTNGKEKTFNTKSLDKDYPLKVSANHHGAGDLVNGQWWPLQICTIRDGAHGMYEGGIYGQAKQGAYSIILAGGGYADIDEGEIIKYCGTSGEEDKPTAFTQRMLESSRLKQPVRVLRSASLAAKHSIYRPAKGLRYDGIYVVTGYELLDKGTAMYRFTLQRCPGQDPIRYQGEEARPTEEELRAYQVIEGYLKSSD